MMPFLFSIIKYFLVLACCTLIVYGCIGSGAAIHEYTLSPLQETRETVITSSAAVSILLTPVLLPPQCNHTGIVTRLSNNSITTSSTHLWAGDLGEQVTSILAENIRGRAPGSDIQIYPGSRYGTPELLIEVRLLRFDGSMNHEFTCTAIWRLSDNRAGELIAQKNFSTTVPVDSNNYSGYVQAASTSLGHLSDNINQYLQKIR
jgi:uncharacterized lipoprotein YmbA